MLTAHLFQGKLEQGAFLMTRSSANGNGIIIDAVECYLIQPDGWAAQLDVYLEMTDEERGRIMQIARKGGYGVIDIHSHPGSGSNVWFSPSDVNGITEFAAYSKWRLPGQPYVAMVWSENAYDAVAWCGEFATPERLTTLEFHCDGGAVERVVPTGSWFGRRRAHGRKRSTGSRHV